MGSNAVPGTLHLLLVDDDPARRARVRDLLDQSRRVAWEVTEAVHPRAAWEQLLGEEIHLLLLHFGAGYGRRSARELLVRIRAHRALETFPVVAVTAAEDLEGDLLDLAATDVLHDDQVLPARSRWFDARCRHAVALRRSLLPESLPFGPGRLHPLARRLALRGHVVRLTPAEVVLARALALARGQPVSYAGLHSAFAAAGRHAGRRMLRDHVASLRRKLGPARGLIANVRGVGYELRVSVLTGGGAA